MKIITRPAFFYAFEGLDVGFIDRTGWISGYVDFQEGVIVIDGEFLLSRATTQDIADAIEANERLLWGPDRFAGGFKQPWRRISDIDHRLCADLHTQHRIRFDTIEKKNFDSDINLVNLLITGKQLLVSEKCVQLRHQLRNGVLNKTRKDMARDVAGGHYDLLAALRYGIRAAEPLLRVNPYPPGYALVGRNRAETNAHTRTHEEPSGLLPNTQLGKALGQSARRRWGRR